MQAENKKWYANWFNTPYYHILYKERDHTEAKLLMDNLVNYLNIDKDSQILDLACGKGRHSVYLNSLGYKVTGADLSEESIKEAKKYESETLHFKVHDMRHALPNKYDIIFNLFTSFGYFDDDEDNYQTLLAIHNSLAENGLACVDFMNVDYVIENLIKSETKHIEGIDFHIKRYTTKTHICKEISFNDKNETFLFTEKVRILRLSDFEEMMQKAGIYLLDVFGDYKLQKFNIKHSPRLLMIFT